MSPNLRWAASPFLALAALLAAGGVGTAWAAGGPRAPARETVELRLRLRQGQVFNRKVSVSQSLSLGGLGQAQLIKRSLALALTFRVTEAKASGAVVEGTYRALVYMQTDLTGTVTWDSAKPTDPVPRAIRELAPLMGKTFHMKITPDGRLGEIEGVDGNVARNLMLIYPDGPVGVGDAWSRRLDLTGQAGVQVFGTFTLTGRRGGMAFLDVRAALKQGAGSVPLDIGPVTTGFGVNGTLDGPLEVEEASGWAVRAKLGYRFSGQIELGGEYQLPFTVAAPFTGEGTVVLEPF